MAYSLDNKVAIVTGSSSGIGEAIALLMAARGASVVVCGRNEDRVRAVLEKAVLASGGHAERFLTFLGDLTDPNVQEQLFAHTIQTFGRLDILVANAGVITSDCSISNASPESYNYIMDNNLKSVFFLIQKALPHLEQTRGNIVNISSSLVQMLSPLRLVSSMSKAALDHMTRTLAVDLGPRGIRVNSVSPGYVPTRIARGATTESLQPDSTFRQQERSRIPLQGRDLTVEDVAETVAFLVSEAAGYITGENIGVSGGRVLMGAQAAT